MTKDNCKGIIPGTFIMCGESDGYHEYFCSDECQIKAEKQKKEYPFFSKDFFKKIFPNFIENK